MAFGMLFSFPKWDFVNVLLQCNSIRFIRLLPNYTIVNEPIIDKDNEELVVCKVAWCNI